MSEENKKEYTHPKLSDEALEKLAIYFIAKMTKDNK
tara:strand:+ start:793 stop:900 length:108 start_codon:yes stop_codon:yes gene_type:complete